MFRLCSEYQNLAFKGFYFNTTQITCTSVESPFFKEFNELSVVNVKQMVLIVPPK